MVVMVVLVELMRELVVKVVDKMFQDRHLLQELLVEEVQNMMEVRVEEMVMQLYQLEMHLQQ
tara:strand:- start:157 stop:342 length:186 start_codon:yes stop_codon:yes gene_type:complete